MATRTHTRYFSENSPLIQTARDAVAEIHTDWCHRETAMDPDIFNAGIKRINLLFTGIELLTEVVPE